MPKNNKLKPVKLPMHIKFGKAPTTKFVNNLNSIKVQLMESPSMDDLRSYLPPFLMATWNESAYDADRMEPREADKIIREALEGKALPTALETINLVFRIDGISLQEVTHILRYRTASFSADCSGDKWWTDKDALVPSSIQNSNGRGYFEADNFNRRYMAIVEAAKKLYCDMIDSKKISIMDARYILPRCLSTFYFMRISLKDALAFIKQRIDRQIQPETDNIIAYQMYIALLDRYPVMNGLINIDAPSDFYIKMARTGKATNLYFPESNSDKFEWNENDFIYQCTRSEMCGTDEGASSLFDRKLADCRSIINSLEEINKVRLESKYKVNECLYPACTEKRKAEANEAIKAQ